MICFLRASTVQYDVRLQKYIKACENRGVPYLALTWDRQNDCCNKTLGEIQYKKYSPYGRKWKNLVNLILWQFHLIWLLLKFRSRYKVIHACNIDTIFPAFIMKLFKKKVVFDIYDSVFIPLERQCIKSFVDLLILPNKRRYEQLGISDSDVKRFLEIENVPSFSFPMQSESKMHFTPDLIHLVYVGVFERNIRGLENLIQEVVENDNLVLSIAGTGAGLERLVKDAEVQTSRVRYYGVVNYERALEIMRKADFIVAMYYNINPLHKYASPNKYYESLFLGVPIITTQCTLVGDMVEKNSVGYVIGETKDDLHRFFVSTKTDVFRTEYERKCKKAKNLWDDKFGHYYQFIICKEYIDVLSSL